MEQEQSILDAIRQIIKEELELSGLVAAEGLETMRLDTAAALYDVKLHALRIMCTRGEVQSTKVGKLRFVTREAMDRVFKGVVEKKVKSKRLSR